MTVAELLKRAHGRYYCQRLTRPMLRKWLLQQVRDGLLEKRGRRFYLTSDGREVAACLAGEVVRRTPELSEAA